MLALCTTYCGDDGDHKPGADTSSDTKDHDDKDKDAAAGESPESGADSGMSSMAPMIGGAGASGSGGQQSQSPCRAASTHETVPALSTAVSPDAAGGDKMPIFTEDLFRQFKTNCGGCHVDNKLGGFQVPNKDVFAEVTMTRQDKIHERLHSDDPAVYMPPAGTPGAKPHSERAPEDPVYQLGEQFDWWFDAGSPPDVFYPPTDDQSMDMMSTVSPYTLTQELADSLTNLGSCIPAASIVGTDGAAMDKLDSVFANIKAFGDLPKTLDQTDLVTLDSEKLARTGVISFAPGYPLFSDNARKMRHVRVPHGKSIVFDKQTQEFTIPDDTRFYKTFLKKVIDLDGNEKYRKIETRLIIARADGQLAADGSHPINAVFATYQWNENETQATLVEDPRRDQTPFRDKLITYQVDEGKAQDVLASTQALDLQEALREAGAIRNYAIPGSDRCIQCHMGGHNKVFILGFTPIQINRRKLGEGGTIEETSDDELSQLQRLIDAKLITGIDKIEDVLPIEKAEGDRAPRNDYELKAQGYMTGNCSHCHNPRGYATVQNPVLKDYLNFFPDSTGGVFQFPLERTSPRIKRGKLQEINIPYITPSLIDLEPTDQSDWGGANYIPKYIVLNEAEGRWVYYMDAPWRSLIYRNIDSPFAYVEDYALYPHMPMNVPGYDCRVPKIMAEWMISIPAKLRNPSVFQSDNAPVTASSAQVPEQPYVEVKPDDEGYDAAVMEAKQRLTFYNTGGRDSVVIRSTTVANGQAPGFTHAPYRSSQYCPDTSDIVDPDVRGTHIIPDDSDPEPSFLPSTARPDEVDLSDPLYAFISAGDGIPNRPHWVVTDVTDPPGPWNPRRIDWPDVLVSKQLTGLDERQQHVVSMLQTLTVTDDFRKFATTEQPFSVWQPKAGCDFTGVPKAESFTKLKRPQWMDFRSNAVKADVVAAEVPLKPEDPIYFQSPGASVFGEICINCHGPKFDSRGRQADNIMLMTGGDTRVANLRDGLLGPVDMPGANRKRVFSAGPTPATFDDWAARYVAWMGLGGTQRVIPTAILNLVGTAQVLGDSRPNSYNAAVESANMLSIAQQLCRQVLGESTDARRARFNTELGAIMHAPALRTLPGTALIQQNGDAEMWLQVCSYMNKPPVRVIQALHDYNGEFEIKDWYSAAAFPSSASLADHRGSIVTGIGSDNLFPWCMVPPATPEEQALADTYVQNVRGGKRLPFCPTDWLNTSAPLTDAEHETWSLQGAINAGVSVFLYLSQRAVDAAAGKQPPPSYDQCDQIKH